MSTYIRTGHNFDRKHVTIVALLGLTLSTLLCGFAWDMQSLFIARLFAGPATSIALAIVTDEVPTAQRGRAMAIVRESLFAVIT
ncbi:hypothetical protein [Rouxiella silvae]|uniref:hypothetical protein n=1 Tax=Rouxiella silvae TaxID=1646373 RepID=UPI001E3D1B21|nr:hypothetical protein [Rouxiella silvae]